MRRRSFAFLILALSLSLPGLSAPVQAEEPLDRIVAVVNDDAIMASELEDRVAQARAQLASRDIAVPDAAALRRQVLDRMVVEQIQLQMAEQANLTVDDTALNRAVRTVAENSGLSIEEFARRLEADGLSLGVVRDQIRREMLMRELQQRRVASRVNVSDREVERYLEQQGGDANARYRLGHILIAVPQSPTPDQVQAAQQEARRLHERLQGGADFATLAAAESDGPNALEGGELGWRRAGELPPVLADTITRLGVGEVSEPLRTPSGFHLIKLFEREGGGQPDGEAQREQVRQLIFQRKVNDELEAWLQQIRAEAYVDSRLEQGGA
ncbi:MAG: peptidylprolyl isomerase [Halomonas sp.]|nr:peptidylprolyl isomerase [Halomonas sp.]